MSTMRNADQKPEHALAMALWRSNSPATPGDAFDAEGWDAVKDEMRSQALKVIKNLEKRGFEISPKS